MSSAAQLARSERQSTLILGPVDDVEEHSPIEHFGFKIARVLLPVRCLSNPEARGRPGGLLRIVRRQGSANALVHHGEAVVCERAIIHA